jgi:hypothetical protein
MPEGMNLWRLSCSTIQTVQPDRCKTAGRRMNWVWKAWVLPKHSQTSVAVAFAAGHTGVQDQEEKQEKTTGGLCPSNSLVESDPPTGHAKSVPAEEVITDYHSIQN